MEAVVFDASAAIACASPDESPSKAIREAARTCTLLVPAVWPFEVYNVLWMLRRRARINADDYRMAQRMIAGWNVELDSPSVTRTGADTLDLAEQFQLTVYDAAYLELARRRRLPLVTLDAELRAAAKKSKITIV